MLNLFFCLSALIMSFEHEDNSSCETECELLDNTFENDVDGNEYNPDDDDNSEIDNEMSIGGGDDDSDDNEVAIANIDDDSDSNDVEDSCHDILVVKPRNLQLNHNSSAHDVARIRWPPGSWQDGTRKSAFQPYRVS